MRPWRGDVFGKAVATLLVPAMLLSGCGTIMPRYLGIRPDATDIRPSESMEGKCKARHKGQTNEASLVAACQEYEGYVEWANQLLESYKTRATMNEWAIYVAGTIALGALGAIGGLGIAAAAATETIGLIGVSSGFAAGFFGMLNNSDRAALYVAAAKEIETALGKAADRVAIFPDKPATYGAAVKIVSRAVRSASINVEAGRYRLAAVAAAAQEQQQAKDEVAEYRRLAAEAAVVDIGSCSGFPRAGAKVDILLTGVDIDQYKGRIKVIVDSKPTLFDEDQSADGKIVDATIPAAAAGQLAATVRVQVGPVTLQGDRQCRYQPAG
jgi:hypothetical protein